MYAITSSDDEAEEQKVLVGRKKKVFRERINFFTFDAAEFKERFRLRPSEAEFVLSYIGLDLQHKTDLNWALSPQQQFLVALHWLSNGAQYHGISDMHGISKSTVSRCVHRVVELILNKMFEKFVRWPADSSNLSQQFLEIGGFPMVCGAVDGTIIQVDAPTQFEEHFINRHNTHSLNCMAVCGPDYMAYSVNARFPGSVHDARILRSSVMAEKFDAGYRPFPGAVILGDSAYGLSDWLIPPLRRNPDCAIEQKFNRAHKRTRRCIEQMFGMIKNRFPCLRHLRVEPEFAGQIFMACCVLHNVARKGDFLPDPEEDEEEPDPDELEPSGVNGDAKLAQILHYFR